MCYQCPTMAAKTSERAQIIGMRVREARDEAGLNNSSLALAAGLPRRTIVRIANGHNEADSGTIEAIARATRKPLDFFRGDNPQQLVEPVMAAAQNLFETLIHEVRVQLAADLAVARDAENGSEL